jgi:hypothetical protein
LEETWRVVVKAVKSLAGMAAAAAGKTTRLYTTVVAAIQRGTRVAES